MRQLVIFNFLVLSSLLLSAQTLKGKVYDATSTLKNIKVLNETQKAFTITDSKGEFSIAAKVNDTLVFQSLFYHSKFVILKPTHFDGITVFELKKIINTLDEVEIIAEPEQPVFKAETYNKQLQNLIAEDIKRNPGLYKSSNANYGVDFVYLIGKLATLFKRKKKKQQTKPPISYEDLKQLVETDVLINLKLITQDLKIPEEHQFLFLEFCATKEMPPILLEETKRMDLLEELVTSSTLFLSILEEFKTSEASKN